MFVLESALEFVGVPKHYISARISDCNYEIPIPDVSGLFLTGPAGRGKTHLATAILADRLPHIRQDIDGGKIRLNAKWATAPELLLELRDSFNSPYENVTEKKIIEKYTAPLLLVLDDLGAEKTTDWTAQSIYTLLSRRINACKPTIVTSNLSLTEIHATDPRLASRLGGMEFFAFDGEDKRLKC